MCDVPLGCRYGLVRNISPNPKGHRLKCALRKWALSHEIFGSNRLSNSVFRSHEPPIHMVGPPYFFGRKNGILLPPRVRSRMRRIRVQKAQERPRNHWLEQRKSQFASFSILFRIDFDQHLHSPLLLPSRLSKVPKISLKIRKVWLGRYYMYRTVQIWLQLGWHVSLLSKNP